MARFSTAFLLCARHPYLLRVLIHCGLESVPVGPTEHVAHQKADIFPDTTGGVQNAGNTLPDY